MATINTIRPNYTIVREGLLITAFSYDTPIVSKLAGKIYLHDDWCYSNTTGKHRNDFLGEGIAETRKKLMNGEYALTAYNNMEKYIAKD